MAIVIKFFPSGDSGAVLEWLEALRSKRPKAAVKLDIDLQTLAECWPNTMNVSVRTMSGWEPLRELKREFGGSAYRIFFVVFHGEMWLLSAYAKGSEKAPRRELENAYRRMRRVMEGSP